MSNHPAFPLIVKVNAYAFGEKEDYAQAAAFANEFRAGNYAALLINTGDYERVTITNAHGKVYEFTKDMVVPLAAQRRANHK